MQAFSQTNVEPLFSIVVPIYRSQENIKKLVGTIDLFFKSENQNYELILVSDSSPDNSWEILKEIQSEGIYPLVIIDLAKNFGQHNATVCGIKHAKGKFLVTMDDDLQVLPNDILKLYYEAITKNADVVYGTYRNKNHHWFRNLGSWFVFLIFKNALSAPVPPTSFRLMRYPFYGVFNNHTEYFINIDGAIYSHTNRIEYVEVDHRERETGVSSYTWKKLLRMAVHIVFNYSTLPLRLITIAGFLISFFSLIFGIMLIYKKFVSGLIPGYASMMVVILFSTGVLMLSLGIISEYLIRMYRITKRTPQFTVREVHYNRSM